MKKFLPYILILIVLVGMFGSVYRTHAQVLMHCYNLDGTERTEPTYEVCLAAGGFWHAPTTPGTGTTAPASKIYNFLAPLPCTGDITTGCDNGKQVTFDPTNTTGQNSNLGIYLNLMIKLFIGICAVLAVIMIVMGGIQYMTSELPGNKEAGKERIMHAIFGLLLALGAWTLLNTINPDLLNTDLKSLADVTVTVDTDESPATAVSGGETSGPITGCPEGMVNASGITVCKSIANNVNLLIAQAGTAGKSLTGGGYRSTAAQTALRVQNCHGDTTSAKPTPPCNPLTALPGTSRHTFGLAIDFRCSGALIQSKDNECFLWLQANAGTYGLSNLPSEPWHWSDNGR
jgi:type IV secretory pathway VirB2 component (pilin)